MDTQPVAFSYIRFSTPDQAKGDSLRRQTEGTIAWCERNNVTLDTTLTLQDLGVSAFKGKHRRDDKKALGHFLDLAKRGRIPAGSYLVIENLDRLSREDERTALRLWMDILDCKIHIVQLKPETVFRHEKSDLIDLMHAIVELSRGHSESRMKSERNSADWSNKRRKAREEKKVITHRLPAWVEERDGILYLIPKPAAAVKQIFHLVNSGYGTMAVVRKLVADGIQPFGTAGHWVRSYVSLIVKDRRALGEYQPRHLDGTPAGAPIPGYYPAVVSETEYRDANDALKSRRGKKVGSRQPKHLDLFAGLIKDARTGGSYCTMSTGGRRLLGTLASREGRGPCASFPQVIFERAILFMLREVVPGDVLGKEGGDKPDSMLELSKELARKEARHAELKELLFDNRVGAKALVEAVGELEVDILELKAKLAEARREAEHPLSEAWGECQTLVDLLRTSPDPQDTRLRLRAVLRRIIDNIQLLVVPKGLERVAFVDLNFKGGGRRVYIIWYTPPKSNGKVSHDGRWWVVSTPLVGNIDSPRSAEDIGFAVKFVEIFKVPERVEKVKDLMHGDTFHVEVIPASKQE